MSVGINPNALEEARADVIVPLRRLREREDADAERSKANAFRIHDVFQADNKNIRADVFQGRQMAYVRVSRWVLSLML